MALLTIGKESGLTMLTEAGNSVLTSSVFHFLKHRFVGNFGSCACVLHVTMRYYPFFAYTASAEIQLLQVSGEW